MNFFMEFANNLGVALTIISAGLTLVAMLVGIYAYEQRPKTTFGSVEYSNYTFQMWTALQGTVIVWVITAIISAVPTPDYIYREKIKTQTKKVYVDRPVTVEKKVYVRKNWKYPDAYQACYEIQSATRSQCHTAALFASNPNLTVRVVYKKDPYRDLFNTCMGKDVIAGGWNLDEAEGQTDGRQLRTERIALCHKQAMEVRNK